MKIIDADESRLIDLPGVGPCPRPVDIDQGVTGFRTLKSLRIYRFQPGADIEGDSEEDEVFVLPLKGDFHIAVSGDDTASAELTYDGRAQALYMPPGESYRLTPHRETLVAYARAAADSRLPVKVLHDAKSGDLAEHLRFALIDLTKGAALDRATGTERLIHVIEGELQAGDAVARQGQTIAVQAGEEATIAATGDSRVLQVWV